MVAEVETQRTPLTASATGEPFLRIRLKGKVVDRVLLNKSRLSLGRSPRADIVLDKAVGVSREHAHILIVDGEVLIEDLSSRNGTFVNGRICQRRTLEHGDRIAIGSYRLRFRDPTRPQVARQTVQEKTADLLRKWNDAAIVERPDECPLCSVELDAQGAADAVPQPANGDNIPGATEPEASIDDTQANAVADWPVGADAAGRPEAPQSNDEQAGLDDPQGLASTDAMPKLVVADSCPTVPSAILLVPDGMRQPAPQQAVDDAIPSGLASAGDTMEGMFPELFLVPASGNTACVPRPPSANPSGHDNAAAPAAPETAASGEADNTAGNSTARRRFRRKLTPRKRLSARRK